MKLICVEEHVLDPVIGTATQGLARAEAPYLPDWGSRVVDGQQTVDPSRPHVIAPNESARKALDMVNRAANDKLALAAQAHPARFAGFATLPWQAPEAAARELERAVKELGLKGALINGRPGGRTSTRFPSARHVRSSDHGVAPTAKGHRHRDAAVPRTGGCTLG